MSPSLRPVFLSLAVVRAERVLLGCVLMYRCYPAFISQLSTAFSSTDVGLAAAIAAGSSEYGWWCLFACVWMFVCKDHLKILLIHTSKTVFSSSLVGHFSMGASERESSCLAALSVSAFTQFKVSIR